MSNKEGIIIFNQSLSEDAAVPRARFDDMSVKESACYLRSLILKMHHNQEDLPHPITAEAISAGQGVMPQPLLDLTL